jgi:hypothetical protein
MILFSAAGLFTATRFTGAEDQSGRTILNPQNVPSWFETGRFRSARWDGGPLEAEKGILTGWVNYTRDDPRQVLKATRDWYNPRTIEFLRKAHINWVWVTCSNGFSPATERAQQETLTRYIELCHQNNIRVAAYFSVGNMFWKDMFEKVPESIAWVDRLEDGSPRFYTRPNRYMADIAHPDWLKLQRQRVEAAARAGTDAFWIDNTFGYYGREKVTHFLDEVYDAASRINLAIVFMSNYNRTILTWGRLQNGVTTEDGEEPGYYPGTRQGLALVTNAGILRQQLAIIDVDLGFRPIPLLHVCQPLADHVFIHVANGGNLHIGDVGVSFDVRVSLSPDAHYRDPDAVIGASHLARVREKTDASESGQAHAVLHACIEKVSSPDSGILCHRTSFRKVPCALSRDSNPIDDRRTISSRSSLPPRGRRSRPPSLSWARSG